MTGILLENYGQIRNSHIKIQSLFSNSDAHVATKIKKQFPFSNVFSLLSVFIKDACFQPGMFQDNKKITS